MALYGSVYDPEMEEHSVFPCILSSMSSTVSGARQENNHPARRSHQAELSTIPVSAPFYIWVSLNCLAKVGGIEERIANARKHFIYIIFVLLLYSLW